MCKDHFVCHIAHPHIYIAVNVLQQHTSAVESVWMCVITLHVLFVYIHVSAYEPSARVCLCACAWLCESELRPRSGQVLCMCFPRPDGLSAGLGRGAGCPPALPPSYRRRSTRPRRPPALRCCLPDQQLPARGRERARKLYWRLVCAIYVIKQVHIW